MQINFKLVYTCLLSIFLFVGCQENNYNKMLDWVYQIPSNTDLSSVKENAPPFVSIEWENPDTINTELYYEIGVEDVSDILKMQNFLVFKGGKYQRRAYRK